MKNQAFILGLCVFAFSLCNAHERSESYSHWYLNDKGVTATVTIPLREVMLLYQSGDSAVPPQELFQAHLRQQISVLASGGACNLSSSSILQAPSGFVRVESDFECAALPDNIQYRALFDLAPSHVHYAKLHASGQMIAEYLMTEGRDTWQVDVANLNAPPSTFSSYLRVGIAHISSGLDHIAFLLGLLLVAGSIGRCVIAITGFTLGHSISLVAAVLGFLHADSQLVEAFIGFTIALVAAEFFVSRNRSHMSIPLLTLVAAWSTGGIALYLQLIPARSMSAYLGFGIFAASYLLVARASSGRSGLRETSILFAATTCFGLIHGFGFAGFLMETGILGQSLFLPLLGFNLGVEIGQLLLVGVALLIARLSAKFTPAYAPQVMAAGLCGLGVYWFVGRTLS